MARGKKHSPELRAAVVAALLAGQGVSSVAKQYEVNKSVVSRWRAQMAQESLQQVATQKVEEFSELVADALKSILQSLKVSADKIRSDEGWKWIQENSPAEFATLIGVLTDKGFRLLEAAEYSSEERTYESDSLEATEGTTNRSIQ